MAYTHMDATAQQQRDYNRARELRESYPYHPLDKTWTAFLWIQHNGKGEVLTDPSAHWRIIDKSLRYGETIYDFLKKSETSNTPMLWGYVANDPSLPGIVVKFLTHLSPGKQDLDYIVPCLKDLAKEYHARILDYDIVDSKTPILESYTPTNVLTTGLEPEQKAAPSGYEHITYDQKFGELENVAKDILSDGATISTIYLGKFASHPEQLFETMIFRTNPDGTVTQGQTIYAPSEEVALQNHYALVDKTNKENLQVQDMLPAHDLDESQDNRMRGTHPEVQDALRQMEQSNGQQHWWNNLLNRSSSTESHEPFMFYHDKLYFGKRHHADILARAMNDGELDWDTALDDPPLFGWLYKPGHGVRFVTDTDIGQSRNSVIKQRCIQLLRQHFNDPEIDLENQGDVHFSFSGWNDEPIPQTPDATWEQYNPTPPTENDPEQLKLFAKQMEKLAEDSDQLRLFNPMGFRALEIDPGEDAGHSDRERPFVYHRPSNTLFYTTQYSHHHHIMPKINQQLQTEGWHPDQFGGIQGPWVVGDITEPEWNDRNWIKFISSEGGGYPESVINFLKDKFGHDRELIYSGPDGWDTLPENAIEKRATVDYQNVPRDERLKEWRWSYDPDTTNLQVWEVENGYPGHYDMTGQQGMYKCVQGRVYLLPDRVDTFYWKGRPLQVTDPEERAELQSDGWRAIQNWIDEHKIREMIPNGESADS